MKIAIIAGKYDGCGVSTYLYQLQDAINKYIGKCEYFVYNCKSYFKENDYKIMKERNIKLIDISNTKYINDNFDIVIAAYHVVPWQVVFEEAEGYYNMFKLIDKPKKVIAFHEHRPSSIIKNYANYTINKWCLDLEFLKSFDIILQYGNNTTSAVFLKDLIGDYEYDKRYVQLLLPYKFNDDIEWISAKNRCKNIEFLGRATKFKDAHRLIRAKDWLDKYGFYCEMRGLGNIEALSDLPDFIYKGNKDGSIDITKKSNKTLYVDEEFKKSIGADNDNICMFIPKQHRYNKIFIYGTYNKNSIYDVLKYSAFMCDFFSLPHNQDYALQSYEYCMVESIQYGIIPIFDYDFGNNCYQLDKAKLTNKKFLDNNAAVWLKKDLSNIEEVCNYLLYLYKNNNEYIKLMESIYDFWKVHTDPKYIVENLIHNICNK